MKIYFTASVSAKELHPEIEKRYVRIVEKLEQLGHKVEADHVLSLHHEDIKHVDDEYRMNYYREMIKTINRVDIVITELSYSSASIGHEISLALEKNKPVIILCEEGRIPQIYKAMQSHDLYFVEYTDENDLLERLEEEINNVKEGEDIRFNFLIPPSMVDYLEYVSKRDRVPKSVYIRNLIRDELRKDKEYEGDKR